jgi:tetratricopeptide (TPR) repeat protein
MAPIARLYEAGFSWRAWACAALLFALLGSLPSAASAQDARARARTYFGEGVAAYDAGRYKEALASFERAYRAAPHPAVRVNMANCFEQLGQYVEALFNFRRYLEESEENVNEEQRTEVELAIARLTPRVGTLFIDLSPRDASLTVDGKEARRTPDGGLQLVAGSHTLRATAPGFVPMERNVDVKGGGDTRVDLALMAEGAVEPVAEPVPEVDEPVSEPESQPALEEPVEAPEPNKPNRALLWSMVGGTVALGAASAVFGALAIGAKHDFNDAVEQSNDKTLDPATRDQAHANGVNAADRADRYALVSDIFLGTAIAAGGATLWIWLRQRKQQRRTADLRISPVMLRHGGGGVAFGGHF